jgi:hypothetical protein
MFQVIAFLACIASSFAFAPSKVARSSSSILKMGFENEIGAQPPLGFWVSKKRIYVFPKTFGTAFIQFNYLDCAQQSK